MPQTFYVISNFSMLWGNAYADTFNHSSGLSANDFHANFENFADEHDCTVYGRHNDYIILVSDDHNLLDTMTRANGAKFSYSKTNAQSVRALEASLALHMLADNVPLLAMRH